MTIYRNTYAIGGGDRYFVYIGDKMVLVMLSDRRLVSPVGDTLVKREVCEASRSVWERVFPVESPS